ncbi:MAG: hypothetical protein JRJ65_08985, partial [Deltaproteobacteria bacterium]|nr:hypothetical protein [Deltaproteobacteria bacterium]
SATAKDALPACPVLYGSGQGAFYKQVRIFDAGLLKETPTAQQLYNGFFQRAKILQIFEV